MDGRIKQWWTIRNRKYRKSINICTSKNEDGTGYLTNIKSISAGQYTMFAITNDGEVYGWGENGSGQLGISNTEDQKLPVKQH